LANTSIIAAVTSRVFPCIIVVPAFEIGTDRRTRGANPLADWQSIRGFAPLAERRQAKAPSASTGDSGSSPVRCGP